MRAEIISIGTELLLGYIADTNAQWLAQQLPALGIDLYWISQVGDNKGRLVGVLQRAWGRSNLIIATGGLGPTEDDVTREAIAAFLGETLALDPDLEQELRALFQRRGRPMSLRNLKQAHLIPSARPLPNPIGTAPGWWVERDNRILVAMPGVPREMEEMWRQQIVPRLRARSGGEIIFTRMLKTVGLPEATLEDRVGAFTFSRNPTIATYAKADGVYLRITAKAPSEEAARTMVAAMEDQVRPLLAEHLYGADDETLEGVVGALLKQKGLTLATMESCTGGQLANMITDVPGSSAYFKGGFVAYTAAMKVALGVPAELIEGYGVVSAEVARAMAQAARQRLGADLGLSTTGVAGPDSLEGKQPGTVYIAVADAYGAQAFFTAFPRPRREVKRWAVLNALNFLRRYLLGEL